MFRARITNCSELLERALEALLEGLVVVFLLLLDSEAQLGAALLRALASARVALAHFSLEALVAKVL